MRPGEDPSFKKRAASIIADRLTRICTAGSEAIKTEANRRAGEINVVTPELREELRGVHDRIVTELRDWNARLTQLHVGGMPAWSFSDRGNTLVIETMKTHPTRVAIKQVADTARFAIEKLHDDAVIDLGQLDKLTRIEAEAILDRVSMSVDVIVSNFAA